MNKVRSLLSQIKRLRLDELKELHKQLETFPNWPGKEAAPVGAKPKPEPPTLKAAAEVEIPRESDEQR